MPSWSTNAVTNPASASTEEPGRVIADPPWPGRSRATTSAVAAGVGGLDRAVDLVGLDVHQLGADGDVVAVGHEPRDHLPLLHRQAPLGHDDGRDALFSHLSHLRPAHLGTLRAGVASALAP